MDDSDDEFVPDDDVPMRQAKPRPAPKKKPAAATRKKGKKDLPKLTLGRITKIGGSAPPPVPPPKPKAKARAAKAEPPRAPATLKEIYPHCVTTENTNKRFFKECTHFEGHHRLTVSCVATFDNPRRTRRWSSRDLMMAWCWSGSRATASASSCWLGTGAGCGACVLI